ncbi:hypothetical protein CIB48_g2529 [Xylaria polymorpha]|nr:hypothetical protein CIB48_g2529 [Xylaria polymorpha]
MTDPLITEVEQDLATKLTEKANQGFAFASTSLGASGGKNTEEKNDDSDSDSESDSNSGIDTITDALKQIGGLAVTMLLRLLRKMGEPAREEP